MNKSKRTNKPRAKRREIVQSRRLEQVRETHLQERWTALQAKGQKLHDEYQRLLGEADGDQTRAIHDRALAVKVAQILHDKAHLTSDMGKVAEEGGFVEGMMRTGSAYVATMAALAALHREHNFTPDEITCDRPH